jgi:outer membrane protein OmpA-like peptidoglycan-associated protein
MKQKICLIVVLLVVMLTMVSCGRKQGVDVTIIILGRRANANAFADSYYNHVASLIRDSYSHGGYVRIIINDGNPRQTDDRFSFYLEDEPNRMERARVIEERADEVIRALRNESLRAASAENDLLQALHVARRLFNEIEVSANGSGRQIGNRRIVIMDTGIVTTGALDFTANGIEAFNFRFSTDEKIAEFASGVAERLNSARQLPDLLGANITFLGFGDVASPQPRLLPDIREGLKVIWRTILSHCNITGTVEIMDFESTHRPNADGFPRVRPIRFPETVSIDNRAVNFNFGSAEYSNPTAANNALRVFATDIIGSIARNPGARLYLVGSESKDQDRPYRPCLSHNRANTVMETLAGFGVPRHVMEVFGLAVYLPRRENDRPGNLFNAEIGARNQKVMIIPSDMGDTAFLEEVRTARETLYNRHRADNCRTCF